MKKLFLVLGITITALLCAESRMCITCNGFFGCKGPVKNCTSPEEICLFIHVFSVHERFSGKSLFVRTCGDPLYCDKNGTMTSFNRTIAFNTSCCDTDSCTEPAPIFAVTEEMVYNHSSVKPNLCPACLGNDTSSCARQYAMPCKEQEMECASLTQTTGGVSTVTLGCASKGFCLHGDVLTFALDREVKVICNASTKHSALPVHFFRYCSQYTFVQSVKVYDKLSGMMCSQDQDVCMMEYNLIKTGGAESIEQIVRCGKSSECNRNGIISNPNKITRFSTDCCYSDMCITTTTISNTQNEKQEKNGIHCKSCFSSTYDECDNQDTMQCTGRENQCVRYIATMTQGKEITYETLYGCTTEKICQSGNRTANYGLKTIDMEITCLYSRSSSIFYIQQISLKSFIFIILSPLTANYVLNGHD